MNLEEIYDGNLNEIKKIPIKQITDSISKQILCQLENNLFNLEKKMLLNLNSDNYFYFYNKKKNLENCILYLKKIK